MALTTIGALAASIALVVPTPVSDPGSPEVCAWREATVRTYQELASLTYEDPASEKAKWDRELRKLLADSGAGKPDFLPEPCRAARALRQSVGSAAAVGADGADRVSPRPDSADATRPRPSAEGTVAGAATSAAERLGWGKPNRVDDFDSEASLDAWGVYDSPGHANNGVRTPDAVSVADGVLTITGDSEGNTGGMAWNPGQKYGRWEGRVSAPASDETYNALLLLWPDAEDFPEGGEIDFMEMMDHTRQTTNLFLHYGDNGKDAQVDGEVKVDATEWHNWAVEWTPDGVTAYLDGEEWWNTTETSILPPGPMHLCIQLDWFPDGKSGDVKESQMHVDWVRQYAIDASEAGTKGLDADSGDSSTTGKSTDGDDADGDSSDGDSSDGDSSDSGGQQSKSRDAGSSDSSDSGDDGGSDDDSSNSSDESDSSDS